MNIYVLDESLQSPSNLQKIATKAARNWKALVGYDQSPVFLTWDARHGFRQVTATGYAPLTQLTAGVLIVHRPDESQMEAIAAVREKEPCLVVLQVRGYAYEGTASEPNWYYNIRTEVGLEDTGFSERFKLFWNDLKKSGGKQPTFSLLEPTAVPAPLLAYALAVQYQLKTENILDLCAAADACYDEIQSFAQSLLSKQNKVPISFPEIRVPPRTVFESESQGDPNGIRFKAMRNMIELVREDL